MKDLSEIARETAEQIAANTEAGSPHQRFMFEEYICEQAKVILHALEAAVGERIAENSRLEQLVQEFQASGLIDVGNVGGPCCVEPKHIEQHVTELRAQLEASRTELYALQAASRAGSGPQDFGVYSAQLAAVISQ